MPLVRRSPGNERGPLFGATRRHPLQLGGVDVVLESGDLVSAQRPRMAHLRVQATAGRLEHTAVAAFDQGRSGGFMDLPPYPFPTTAAAMAK